MWGEHRQHGQSGDCGWDNVVPEEPACTGLTPFSLPAQLLLAVDGKKQRSQSSDREVVTQVVYYSCGAGWGHWYTVHIEQYLMHFVLYSSQIGVRVYSTALVSYHGDSPWQQVSMVVA